MSRILFELNHPKHYYQFRGVINQLKNEGSAVYILARDKDVLLEILNDENQEYILLGKHGKSIFSKVIYLPKLLITYLRIVKKLKIDIIFSKASLNAALIKPFINAKHIITPDSEVVSLTNKIVAPLSDIIITPENFNIDFGINHHRISGFFEETYLSPLVFTPDINLLKEYNLKKPFFILRFISWDANHDIGNWGFTDSQKNQLFDLLNQYGQVIISAERNILPAKLQENRIAIPPSKMHHFLHYANMYIGDSQSMATESSLLGTPSFRYNSFVGDNDMTNFIVLEKELDLLRNYISFEKLIEGVKKVLENPEIKEEWLIKRDMYFKSKEDINQQFIQIALNN
jgi:predicted glycosyltransferase